MHCGTAVGFSRYGTGSLSRLGTPCFMSSSAIAVASASEWTAKSSTAAPAAGKNTGPFANFAVLRARSVDGRRRWEAMASTLSSWLRVGKMVPCVNFHRQRNAHRGVPWYCVFTPAATTHVSCDEITRGLIRDCRLPKESPGLLGNRASVQCRMRGLYPGCLAAVQEPFLKFRGNTPHIITMLHRNTLGANGTRGHGTRVALHRPT